MFFVHKGTVPVHPKCNKKNAKDLIVTHSKSPDCVPRPTFHLGETVSTHFLYKQLRYDISSGAKGYFDPLARHIWKSAMYFTLVMSLFVFTIHFPGDVQH